MANLSTLLSRLQRDEMKYYVLQGRDLYTEDNFSILQNDNNSTKIKILLPIELGGFTIDSTYNFYVDYIDGAGKPGVVNNKTALKKVYKKQTDGSYTAVPDNQILIIGSGSGAARDTDGNIVYLEEPEDSSTEITIGNLRDLENQNYIVQDGQFVLEPNTQYSIDGRNYTSLVKHENFEDSAEISLDFNNPYSDTLYFIKTSPNLTVASSNQEGVTAEGQPVQYLAFTWTLDKQVTNAAGQVTFSIRIEKPNSNYSWQSNTVQFPIVSNLKETYYLKKEIEENFVIQNRTIKPVGNFENVLVKGDTNSNKLFYKMNRYFQGQDILAPKTYTDLNNKIFNVQKNQNGVFGYQDENTVYGLPIKYAISNIDIYRNGANGSYDVVNNSFTIDGVTYQIKKVVKEPVPQLDLVGIYQYKLYYQNGKSLTTYAANLTGLSSTVELNNGMEKITYVINIDGVANEFDTPSWLFSYSDATPTDPNIWAPVFNRLIRFIFMSPNKDYGDWNNGEIEYINTDEDYFIFSWTPDARATRSEGELSYYIEFFINGNYEEILEDTGISVVRTKAYSWSTLPTTIRVESNEAATATVNYIPHWVSYIENDLQDDMDSFLNNDLQSQYNSFEEYLTYSMLGDYYSTTLTAENGQPIIGELNVENLIYTVEQKDTNFNISNDVTNTLIQVTTHSLNDSNIYGAALQLRGNRIEIAQITDGQNNNIDFTVDDDTITIIINGVFYNADFPTTEVSTIEFSDGKKYNITYTTALINDYYLIYNKTRHSATFYELENENGISVPFLTYAKERIAAWETEGQNQLNSQQNNFDALRTNIVNQFGIDGVESSTDTNDLYHKVWNYFNSLGSTLSAIYSGSDLMTLKLVDKDGNETGIIYENNDEYGSFGLTDREGNTITYYVKVLNGYDSLGTIQQYVEIETDKSDFFVTGKYYNSEQEKDSDIFDTRKTYYDNQRNIVTFVYHPLVITTPQDSDYYTIGNSEAIYCIVLNTLYNKIENDIEQARVEAAVAYQLSSEALEEEVTEYKTNLDSIAEANRITLEQNYNNAISDFYATWSAQVNSDLLNYIANLQIALNDLIIQNTSQININASANTLIITPNQTTTQ